MSDVEKNILVLEMDLFPDGKTVASALQTIESSSNIRSIKIEPEHMDQSAWAEVLGEILSADVLLAL